MAEVGIDGSRVANQPHPTATQEFPIRIAQDIKSSPHGSLSLRGCLAISTTTVSGKSKSVTSFAELRRGEVQLLAGSRTIMSV